MPTGHMQSRLKGGNRALNCELVAPNMIITNAGKVPVASLQVGVRFVKNAGC